MSLLAIDWPGVGIKTLQFILSFSILVTLHELGHFLTARWFKCRVEKFYLFFNPWFSLWKKKIGDTEYGIGWVPFGGYVKIAGMVDESMDKEQMKLPAAPDEFRAKPAWQRLIIMVAGVIVNVLLALFLFIMITYKWGEEYLPPQNLQYGIYADSLGKKIGLQDGDMITSVDHKKVDNFISIPATIVVDGSTSIQVKRNGRDVNLPIPDGFAKELNKNKLEGFAGPQFPVIVDSVTNAEVTQGKLMKNDQLIGINGHTFQYFNQFNELKEPLKNQLADITLLRGSDTVHIKSKLNDHSQVGFLTRSPGDIFTTVVHTYTFAQAIPEGVHRCFQTLGRYIGGLRQMISGKVAASDSLGSVISIGNTFPNQVDWEKFWTLTAIFSIILAFMNILPIPALDGGHALILHLRNCYRPQTKR